MDYGTKYLTFAEYTALGGSITDENAFNLLEYEARKEININTLNRIVNLDTIPNEVIPDFSRLRCDIDIIAINF